MRTLHTVLMTGEVVVRGRIVLSAPQPVGTDGGIPNWVADALEDDSEVTAIVLIRGEQGGVMYRRIEG